MGYDLLKIALRNLFLQTHPSTSKQLIFPSTRCSVVH